MAGDHGRPRRTRHGPRARRAAADRYRDTALEVLAGSWQADAEARMAAETALVPDGGPDAGRETVIALVRRLVG